MWLEPLFANPWLQNVIATCITLAVAIAWLRAMNYCHYQGWMPQTLSRKVVHIGTGPLFVLCWNLFSPDAGARYFAALVPLVLTMAFLAIGLGWAKDEALVQAISRHGDRCELLRGPLYYGIAFIACTTLFWPPSPVGILALMLMCGGDGLADIIGRRLGTHKLPFNPDKSWAGSAAMFLGGFAFGYGFLALFTSFGTFEPGFDLIHTASVVAAIAFVATLIEALPMRDIDNLTLTLSTLALGQWLL